MAGQNAVAYRGPTDSEISFPEHGFLVGTSHQGRSVVVRAASTDDKTSGLAFVPLLACSGQKTSERVWKRRVYIFL